MYIFVWCRSTEINNKIKYIDYTNCIYFCKFLQEPIENDESKQTYIDFSPDDPSLQKIQYHN